MNVNMTVINKDNNKQYDIYDITYSKAGYPRFLIYKDGQWVRMSAKHFRPTTIQDMYARLTDFNSITI